MTYTVSAPPPDASWPFVLSVAAVLLLLVLAAGAATRGRRWR